jgi:hypothetical protein
VLPPMGLSPLRRSDVRPQSQLKLLHNQVPRRSFEFGEFHPDKALDLTVAQESLIRLAHNYRSPLPRHNRAVDKILGS